MKLRVTALVSNSTEALQNAFDALCAQISAQMRVAHDDDDRALLTLLLAYHNTTQSHTTSAAWEAVNFNSEDDLRGVTGTRVPLGLHSKTTRTDRFLVPGVIGGKARRVRGHVRVTFATNATGSRGVYLAKNEALYQYLWFGPAATAAGASIVSAPIWGTFDPQDVLQVFAYQNSGGALNMGSASRDLANEIELEWL